MKHTDPRKPPVAALTIVFVQQLPFTVLTLVEVSPLSNAWHCLLLLAKSHTLLASFVQQIFIEMANRYLLLDMLTRVLFSFLSLFSL